MKLKGYVIILLISLSSKNNKTNLLTYKKSKNSSHFCMLKLNENTWYAMLCDLVSFLQFKKRKKCPWSSVTFSKVAGWSMQFY